MSKAFSLFYDHLLPELPGCGTGLLDQHLLQVTREFCNRSSAWRGDLPTIAYEADRYTYPLFTPEAKSEVVRVLELRLGDELWWALHEPDATASEQPLFAAHLPPFSVNDRGDEITLTEDPTGDVTGVVAIRPSLAATTLPDVMLNEHLEVLRMGVLSRLMLMGSKPWTDRDLGTAYRRAYDRGTEFAASRAALGNTRARLRTRLSPI